MPILARLVQMLTKRLQIRLQKFQKVKQHQKAKKM